MFIYCVIHVYDDDITFIIVFGLESVPNECSVVSEYFSSTLHFYVSVGYTRTSNWEKSQRFDKQGRTINSHTYP